MAFVGLGAILRVATFAINSPLWGDEAFVAANFITRDYADLLKPLDYGQVCPLFFLWIELTVVKLLGFSEYSLRLFPTACSVASLFLFAHVAGRVVQGPARLVAVAIFSVAYYPIRHGAEVKPYSTDLLAALILLAFAIEYWRRPATRRWLWAMVFTVPLLLGLSQSTVFMAGGVSLGLAARVWTHRQHKLILPFLLYNTGMVATFALLFVVFTGAQQRAHLALLRSNYWAAAFPPLHQPLAFAGWLVEAHTGRMFAYPFGDAHGGSGLTTLCFMSALVALWRRGEKTLVMLAIGPFALAFVAAVLGCYPYGGSARTMIFVAPTICLFSAMGLTALIARIPVASVRERVYLASVLTLAACGIISLGFKIAYPYKSKADENSRQFAKAFWNEKSQDAELVCVKSDLGLGFDRRNWSLFRSALYLCNQKIYSPRHWRGQAPDWDTISPSRPLRCVMYNEAPETNPSCLAWLAMMKERFQVISTKTFIINESSRHDDGTDVEDRYTVYELVPRYGHRTRQLARSAHSSDIRVQY